MLLQYLQCAGNDIEHQQNIGISSFLLSETPIINAISEKLGVCLSGRRHFQQLLLLPLCSHTAFFSPPLPTVEIGSTLTHVCGSVRFVLMIGSPSLSLPLAVLGPHKAQTASVCSAAAPSLCCLLPMGASQMCISTNMWKRAGQSLSLSLLLPFAHGGIPDEYCNVHMRKEEVNLSLIDFPSPLLCVGWRDDWVVPGC